MPAFWNFSPLTLTYYGAVRTLVLFLFALVTLQAQSKFVQVRGSELLSPSGQPLLLKGTNLGNWLEPEGYMFGFKKGPESPREIEEFFDQLVGPIESERFWREWRQQYITENDIAWIERAGFNSVRVPLHYKFFLADGAEGFPLLDRLVDWCRQHHLWVILDLHCAPGGQTGTNIDDSYGYPWLYEEPESQQLTMAIWKRIAARYQGNPTVLGYDLLNEPIPHFPALRKYNDRLEPLYKRVASAVREVDKNHVLILGGAQWDSNFKVFGAPFDSNTMYTFHKYWTAPDQNAIAEYVQFRDRYHVPIWLGESGENNDAWVSEFRKLLETNRIGWCFWPYKKMDQTSAPVSFPKPVHWDAILAFAAQNNGTGNAEKQIGARPSIEDSRAALQDLLIKIKLENCRVNSGYLNALGMKTPLLH